MKKDNLCIPGYRYALQKIVLQHGHELTETLDEDLETRALIALAEIRAVYDEQLDREVKG